MPYCRFASERWKTHYFCDKKSNKPKLVNFTPKKKLTTVKPTHVMKEKKLTTSGSNFENNKRNIYQIIKRITFCKQNYKIIVSIGMINSFSSRLKHSVLTFDHMTTIFTFWAYERVFNWIWKYTILINLLHVLQSMIIDLGFLSVSYHELCVPWYDIDRIRS